jgi:phosphomannomutase
LLESLGVEAIEINCKTDGDFYRDPEPRPETLIELAGRVNEEGADLGFACDPDADRLALVDAEGSAISEEYTLALAVDHVLSRERGPVVINMSTSSVVERVARDYGVELFRTPVGEVNVVDLMLVKKAVVGGEGNGGVIYPRLHPGRDAPLGMALILQLLADRAVSLREQVATYPPFYITKEKVGLSGEFSPAAISGLIEELNPDTIDTRDGVKAYFGDGWFHLRVSNTEGVVRVIAEGSSREQSLAHQETARKILRASWKQA